MKPIIVDFTDDFLDLEDFKAERALQLAALDAMDRSERFGSGFVVSAQSGVLVLKGEDLRPYRQRALANLDRINQKIAQLQSQETAALILNDRPADKPPAK